MAAFRLVTCRTASRVDARPEVVYHWVADPERFPQLFRGFGPVPGISRIHAGEGEAPRRVVLEDGNVLEERFDVMEPGERLCYQARGFGPPLGWWCDRARGEWTFRPAGDGTEATWVYGFHTVGLLQRWAVGLTVAPLFQLAMADCIRRLAIACRPPGLQ